MKNIFKKVASAVITLSMVAQLAVVASAADLPAEVGYAYGYVDTADYDIIDTAYAHVAELENYIDWENDSVKALVNDAVTNRFGDEETAKTVITNFMKGSLMVYFSKNEDNFAENIDAVIADEAINAAIVDLFDVNAQDWLDVLFLSRKNAENSNDWNDRKIWATGSIEGAKDSLEELIANLDELMVQEATKLLDSEYQNLANGMGNIEWTVEMLVAAVRAVTNSVDEYNAAEYALTKAACRSAVKFVYGDEERETGINYEDNEFIGMVDSEEVTEYVKVYVIGHNVTNLIGFDSSNEELVTIEATEEDENNNRLSLKIAPSKNGIADITIKRDPRRNNSTPNSDWIAKFRIVAIYDIATVAKPETLKAENGKIIASWAPVNHAKKYYVQLLKDGNIVDGFYVDGASTTADVSAYVSGAGGYTYQVIAEGDYKDYGEHSEEFSPESDVFTIVDVPEKVAKPVWEATKDATITWTAPTAGATPNGYVLTVYKNGEKFRDTILVDGADTLSYDLSSFIGDEKGSFTVTVAAKNDAGTGEASEMSDALEIKALTYKVSGYLKIFSNRDSGYRTKNNGIRVMIAGFDPVFTNEDGTFEIKGIPEGTYDISITKNGVLGITNAKIEVLGGNVQLGTLERPIVLNYGDLNGQDGIDSGDYNQIIRALIGYVPFDEDFDFNENGIYDIDELLHIGLYTGTSEYKQYVKYSKYYSAENGDEKGDGKIWF